MKYLAGGFLFEILSERQIEQRFQKIVTLRRYLVGIDLDGRVSDHSTISQLRRKPAFQKVFQQMSEETVRQCVEKGLVSRHLTVMDPTHMKDNVS